MTSYQQRQARRRAIGNLEQLRAGTMLFANHYQWLRADLAAAGCSLEAIGGSEEELEKLEKLSHKVRAMRMLSSLREETKPRTWFFTPFPQRLPVKIAEKEMRKLRGRWAPQYGRDIRRAAMRGGFRLTEIGTSEEELRHIAA